VQTLDTLDLGDADALIIVPPFAASDCPSLAAHLLQACAAQRGLREHLIPARRDQRPLSVHLAQDLVWLLLETGLKSVVILTWMRLVAEIYNEHLRAFSVQAMQDLPVALRIAAGVLLADLIGWFQHWLRHKIPWLWEFHKIHHAQPRINLFTDARLHIVDWTAATTIRYVLMLMLGVPPVESMYFALIADWYTRAYHANLRTNLGPLRYLLVSPQFHRVHHSIEEAHRDKNFAVLFPVWDHLFGTKSPDDHEYPETGVADPHFPPEPTSFGLGLLTTPLVQMVYPFRAIAAKLRLPSIILRARARVRVKEGTPEA